MENFLRRLAVFLIAGTGMISQASALSPHYPRGSIAAVEEGRAAPYVGSWSLSFPSEEAGRAGTTYATCDKPLRIEAADETHIFYLGPNETEADAAIQLVANGGQTDWEPIAGGPRSFTIWIAEDTFHLYDAGPLTEAEWARPLVYQRCP